MASNVPIFVENYQTGYRPSANVPVNGRQQTFAAMFNNDNLVANVIGVNGDAPEFVTVRVGPPLGPYFPISDSGAPLNLNGSTDISPWVIVAFVPLVNSANASNASTEAANSTS